MVGKNALNNNITTIKQLKKYIELDPKEEKILKKIAKIHPFKISKYYLSLIDKKNKVDPLRKQMIPSISELSSEGSYDTSGEKSNTKTVGLQHKYKQTALILATNRCVAYCRFCFRKRLVGLANNEVLKIFDDAFKYIKEHKEITNVLISGGDPLTLNTKIIERFLKKLHSIDHLEFIRIGTRIPNVLPDRILKDKNLLDVLKKYSTKNKRIYIISHFNHPNEITKDSIEAINKLINANVIINNQTVLMKGVNDNPNILAELLNKLVSIGVNPYYVFQCRPVKGIKKGFQVPLYKSIQIVEDAKKKMNGHSKRFKFIMSHKTGKIEIIGVINNYIYFKYNQAKNLVNIGKFFKKKLNKKAAWLDELD